MAASPHGSSSGPTHTDSHKGLSDSPLGKISENPTTYTPSLLHSIPRAQTRQAIGLPDISDVLGVDIWNGYEFSWLNAKGKPEVSGLRLHVPCQSRAIVESKSLKLYLNSFAMTRFDTTADVQKTLDKDLSLAFQAPVVLELLELSSLFGSQVPLSGFKLDDLDVAVDQYTADRSLLQHDPGDNVVHELLYTDLFRSLCPVTGQPDWASLSVEYAGRVIDRSALLKYLISFRNHQAFHETTVEQIYVDLREVCNPERLTVHGRFVRRGGLDINPFRSNVSAEPTHDARLPRQ